MEAPALSEQFIDWWFSPWRYARANDVSPMQDRLHERLHSTLGRRDAYRHWCAEARVTPQLPSHPDWQWQWQAAALSDTDQLLQSAELFGGMLAARRQRHDELAQLSPQRRRWCLSVALTQPLADWTEGVLDGADGATVSVHERGLLELALRLDRGFPGMWSRLRLLLPPPLRATLQAKSAALSVAGGTAVLPLRDRDRRCWQMCVTRSHEM